MARWFTKSSSRAAAGAPDGLWRLMLLLAVAVAVPSACVLWFMNQAVRNERFAVRQKLVEAYTPALQTAAGKLSDYWQGKVAALGTSIAAAPADAAPAELAAPARFARLVTSGACASAVIYDAEGRAIYPADPDGGDGGQDEPPDWADARSREYVQSNPAAAAEAYAIIAAGATGAADLRARALVAQARCLAEAGQAARAVEVLKMVFTDQAYRDARDPGGRLLAPEAGQRALELTSPPSGELLDALAARLNDYAGPAMPSSQRRFLMRRLMTAREGPAAVPTLAAEDLAAEYLDHHPAPAEPGRLVPSGLPGVWRATTADGTAVALFQEQELLDGMRTLAAKSALPGARITLLAAGESQDGGEPFLTAPLGESLPGWRLALHLEGEDPFGRAAGQRVAAYLWASLLSIGAIALVAVVAGRHLLRQARLTRLKNDFIATVTHELKTPLASVRLFAETLRDGRYEDPAQAARYLDLLVRENERLSRLIDNFLSFSRMERNKQAFEFARVEPGELARAAADAVGQRFESPGCSLTVEVAPGLPPVNADKDAMVTVLLNLLDNAWKYTGEQKQIVLRVNGGDGAVCFEVEDNGIGMSRREARRAFDRFYQADSSLSRSAGGCGLGLSIVKFIVDAHGGTVSVRTEPGKGSTFAVRLPATAGLLPTTPEGPQAC